MGFLKTRLRHRCFSVNFAKILRKPFFYKTPLVAASNNGRINNWEGLKAK